MDIDNDNDNNNYTVIHVQGGLANCLRFIFTHYLKCIDENKRLVVIWSKTDQCNGYFDEIFENNIPKINIMRSNHENFSIDYTGNAILCKKYNPYRYDTMKNSLVLLPHIKNKIDHIISNNLNYNYITLHIRRTDLGHFSWKNCPDKNFIEFVNTECPKEYKIYLATDNQSSQNKFKELYGDRIITYKDVNLSGLRRTSLEHAVIDLYVCGSSEFFMGTTGSSFTNYINHLRYKY
jgi:hypothetical protein